MRGIISKFVKMNVAFRLWLASALVVLAVLATATFGFMISRALEAATSSSRYATAILGETGAISSDLRDAETGQRGYLITGRDEYLSTYRNARNDLRNHTSKLASLVGGDQGLRNQVAHLTSLIDQRMDDLDQAIGLRQDRALPAAAAIVASGRGKVLMDEALASVGAIEAAQNATVETVAEQTANLRRLWLWLGIGGDAVLIAIIVVVTRRSVRAINRPINALIDAVSQAEQGIGDVRVIADRPDEFGDLGRAFNVMADYVDRERERRACAEEDLDASAQRLTERTQDIESRDRIESARRQMTHRLAGCASEAEWAEVIERFAPQLAIESAGTLYVTDEEGRTLDAVAQWGTPHSGQRPFEVDECWALRRSSPYVVRDAKADIVCRHMDPNIATAYCCLPLVSHGAAMGLLCLENSAAELSDAGVEAVAALAEALAVTLANYRLRATVGERSLRDPLTHLFSPAYLEEAWSLEAPRAERANAPLALWLAEIDNFKALGNHYGPEAGDFVVAALAHVMQSNTRAGDIVCRFSDERFVVVQPAMTQTMARQSAERLCAEIRGTPLRFNGTDLGNATISVGIAVFPYAGATLDSIIESATRALTAAVERGGNCAELAVPVEGTLFPLPPV